MRHATITEATLVSDSRFASAAKARGRSLRTTPAWFSAAYFSGALVTDLAYWQVPDVLWERFSIWLVTAGLIMAGLAIIAYVIDLAGGRQIEMPALPRVTGYAFAVLLSLMNAFIHSRDGYTAVVPTGLMLSVLVVVVLLLTVWVDRTSSNRHQIGG